MLTVALESSRQPELHVERLFLIHNQLLLCVSSAVNGAQPEASSKSQVHALPYIIPPECSESRNRETHDICSAYYRSTVAKVRAPEPDRTYDCLVSASKTPRGGGPCLAKQSKTFAIAVP